MKQLGAVLHNRNIALLLFGRLVAMTGDWLYTVALSVAIYQYSHGSSLLVGLLWVTRLVPALLLPLGGRLADRVGYRRSAIIASLGRMATLVVVALILTPTTWAIMYPLTLVFRLWLNLFRPANVGLIPSLVNSSEEQLAANASGMAADSIAIILGSTLGGVVTGLGLLVPLLLIQAGLYGVSAFSAWLIRPRVVAGPAGPVGPEEVDRGFVAGVRLLARRPVLVFAASIMALPELAQGAIFVWIVPYSLLALHLGSAGSGYCYAAIGLGLMVGGIAASSMGSRQVQLDRLLATGVAMGGLAIVVFGLWPVALPALLALAAFGLATTLEYAAFETLLQQSVPAAVLGQTVGTMDSLFFNMMLVGNALSGLLAAWLGLSASIAGLGGLTALVAGTAWWRFRQQTAQQPTAGALAAIPIFARLPEETRDWAAHRMVREEFSPGAVIVRQGDVGNIFYVIAGGKAEVEAVQDGRTHRNELSSGDFFGEIALLHDVPRTATVRAVEPLTTYALSRTDFQELQAKAADFKGSLLEVATNRLQRDATLTVAWAGA